MGRIDKTNIPGSSEGDLAQFFMSDSGQPEGEGDLFAVFSGDAQCDGPIDRGDPIEKGNIVVKDVPTP